MSKVYDVTEASDFWTVVGHNTEYVISPYNYPQLIQNIITALKQL